MAPLPDNNTARIRVNYHDQWNQHSMTFRFADLAAPATALDAVDNVIAYMLPLVWDNTVFTDAEYALEGSDVFNPLPGFATSSPSGNGTPGTNASPARYLQFGGRTVGGRRVKLYLFGVRFDENQQMRYAPGGAAPVGGVIDALNSTPSIVAIDGLSPVWKAYANYGYNDALTQKARG